MKRCPICGGEMRKAGVVRPINPLTNRKRKCQVWACRSCGRREI